MPTTLEISARIRRIAFPFWLMFFYCSWVTGVTLAGYWPDVLSHWPISLAMAFGSYIAGSTPMGGGTVGFPILILLFDYPGAMGRNFGLAIQSIGMVSASIYILSRGLPVHWQVLRPALLGSLLGTPLAATFIAPHVPDIWVKLIFAIIWASFGLMHLFKLKELIRATETNVSYGRWDIVGGLGVGLLGGVVSSLTGVGIDMLVYALLVLRYRCDLKVAIPTSVILMAVTSLIGISFNNWLTYQFPEQFQIDREVFFNWLAAAPVVAVGAPLGAWVVSLISRTPTLILVSVLCVLQFFWTVFQEQVTGLPLAISGVAVLGINGLFILLYQSGHDK